MKDDVYQVLLSVDEVPSLEMEEIFGGTPRLILGYIPPGLDFKTTAETLKRKCRSAVLILTSTAGELCSRNGNESRPLYLADDPDRSEIVLQGFSESIIADIDIHTMELYDPDLQSDERIRLIQKDFASFTPAFPLNHRHCVAYTLIDGLSRCESFFMEALYTSGKVPCLTMGGSAGGLLDFKNTYIFNNREVVQNKAVMTLIRFRDDIKMGVFKSQNFEKTSFCMTVGEAVPSQRYIRSIIHRETGELTDVISHLSAYFQCDETDLEEKLQSYSFAITIDDDIYVRSISGIDFDNRTIHFYCDLAFGDELVLVKHSYFLKSIEQDYREFQRGKNGRVLGGLFNDCILRRLVNGPSLADVNCFSDLPIAGFSTFGELLGVNINQTLTALFLYRIKENESFHDAYIDNFIMHYSGFKEFFLLRKLNQQNQIMMIKDQVWESSRECINTMAEFIDRSSRNARSNDQLMEMINNNFTELYENIEESRSKGSVISKELTHLGKSADVVEKILYDIVDIAGQTNILGFNASIEAARAGQSRGGFSVIAKEVKNLADKTDKQVRASKDAVTDVINRMETLNGQVKSISSNQERANELSNEINDYFFRLTDSSKDVEQQLSSHTIKIKGLMDNIDKMLSVVQSLE
ncbi:MAG: methyl-accepting chemotaxis protein [Spirochaetales bacterium]|nr:methyl-accepting chemotaxis protein [Spirochaetales bacterium]